MGKYNTYREFWLPSKTLPLNDTIWIEAHNTYSTIKNGIFFPAVNQKLTITEILNDTPVRLLSLDAYYDGVKKEFYMTHSKWDVNNMKLDKLSEPLGIKVRTLQEELMEIRAWLDKNPTEVVMIHLEEQFSGYTKEQAEQYRNEFVKVFGNKVYTNNDKLEFYKNNSKNPNFKNKSFEEVYPSLNQIIESGKQILLFSQYFGKEDFLSDSTSRYNNDSYFLNFYSLAAVGEDKTLAGKIGRDLNEFEETLNKTFNTKIDNIPNDIAPEFSVENLYKYKMNRGDKVVTVIALDFIKKNDKRLIESFEMYKKEFSLYTSKTHQNSSEKVFRNEADIYETNKIGAFRNKN
ncbi:MAG: hypothetical protein J0H68_08500 [Sphingobacteriia bacterium]|nr:hypothetical protein [Sphingobacteriia bacterium]